MDRTLSGQRLAMSIPPPLASLLDRLGGPSPANASLLRVVPAPGAGGVDLWCRGDAGFAFRMGIAEAAGQALGRLFAVSRAVV